MSKTIKIIKIFGLILILIGFTLNPFMIERFFSPDQQFDFAWKYFVIGIFNLSMIITGLYTYNQPDFYKKQQNIILLVSIIILFILLIESFSFVILQFTAHPIPLKDNFHYLEKDNNLGYHLKKDSIQEVAFSFPNKTLIYNITYTIDKYGRRIINQENYSNNPHILLFGGSFAYGLGIEDNETLQYNLKKDMLKYNIYNYAVEGYGPQHTLAILEKGNLPKEVKSNKGIALYIFIPNHINRATGSANIDGSLNFPYYFINKTGTLQRKGSFITGRPLMTNLISLFSFLQHKSNFLKLIGIEIPSKISEEDLEITYEIIAESERLYKEQFNGTFYMVIHPFSYPNSRLTKSDLEYFTQKEQYFKKLFEKGDIILLDYKLGNHEQYKIPGDEHPNRELNKILSRLIAKDLLI